MKLRMWQIDAFAEQVFAGNPAAVCPLEAWLPDATLRAIAAENNLSETAFLLRDAAGWHIRWFTPVYEVELCGHATLASAHVVLTHLEPGARAVTFASQSGPLTVSREPDGLLSMVFPRHVPVPGAPPPALVRALGRAPREAVLARDWIALLDGEEAVRACQPDLAAVRELPGHGLVVTAPARSGAGLDFVSRYFAPQAGIPEDPVTGSIDCALVPYWAARLGKRRLEAFQASARGGRLRCEDRDDSVVIAGRTAEYLSGEDPALNPCGALAVRGTREPRSAGAP
ncbi:MAG: PhzF family phenazine biosynthesis protein [Anaeromyxobacter sp.]